MTQRSDKAIDTPCSCLERLDVPLDRVLGLPAYQAIYEQARPILSHNGGENGFVIWGGLAANLLLMLSGHTRQHFCIHDIEIFSTTGDAIANDSGFAAELQHRLAAAGDLPLPVGGSGIVGQKAGMSVREFQRQRVTLLDGDLLLHNIVASHSIGSDTVCFILPRELKASLCAASFEIRCKSSAGLDSAEKIARRIRRNVSKATRFHELTAARISSSLIDETVSHFHRFLTLSVASAPTLGSCGSSAAAGSFDTPADAAHWLCSGVLAETAMRNFIQNRRVVTANDDGLMNYLSDAVFGDTGKSRMPLLSALMTEASNNTGMGVASLLEASLLNDYRSQSAKYQVPSALDLIVRFSLVREAVIPSLWAAPKERGALHL